jgi:membrane-bound metal-dependent hydrolase YbcI (DUF457 family)
MFIGHFAVAYAGKRVAPRTNLAWLFVAAQLADLIWPILLLQGVETVRIAPSRNPFLSLDFTSYPWSHSLLMDVLWGVVLASVYYTWRRDRNGAGVTFTLVVSHWVLDWVTHVPDMPLYPGGAWRLGLGLWNSPAATIAVELVMYAAGVWVYMHTTQAKDRFGKIGGWALVVFLLLLYAASIYSPPPPSVTALAIGALIGWPLAFAPWWTDRHRTT